MPDQTPQDYIREQARAMGVPEALALGVADQESSFNPLAQGKEFEVAPGKKTRAYGMFQLLPDTAARYAAPGTDPLQAAQDPVQNVHMGLQYLKELHDQYGGNLDQVLQHYGGVRTDTTYIPSATAKILHWQEQLGREHYLAGGSSIHAPSFGEEHPWLNSMVQGFDPNEREGRQNYAGMIGGTLGAMVGGPPGSVIGAGLFGGAENALVEETGLGQKIADFLPGETNGPPPDPDSTPLGRTASAVGWQAGGDLVGQGVAKFGTGLAKKFVQSDIARDAFKFFQTQRTQAVESLKDAVEALTQQHANLKLTADQTLRGAGDTAAAATEAARLAGDQTVKGIAQTGAQDVRGAQVAKASILSQSRDAAARAIRDARARAAALLKGNTEKGAAGIAEQEAAYDAGRPPRPSFTDAGQAAIDAVEQHSREAFNQLGRAVDEAADNVPGTVNIRDLKAEAERIARQDLLPPEETFPRGAPPPPPSDVSPIIDPSTGKPFPASAAGAAADAGDDDLAGMLGELTDEERKALMQNPAFHVIGRILRSADDVPFKDAHLWKSQLQAAVRGAYGDASRTQAEGITMKVAKELRKVLSGNEAYDAATAAYAKAAPAFTETVGQTIRSVARDSPEQIVGLLNPERPSHARTLVKLLTDFAEEGGGKEGAQAGKAALTKLREAYLHKNLFDGPLEGLGERLTKLRSNPEFVDALFGDEYDPVLRNLDEIVKAYNDKVVEATSLQTAAKMQGKHGVETTRDASRASIEEARKLADEALQGTRTAARGARDTAKEAAAKETRRVANEGRRAVEGVKQGNEAAELGRAADRRAARRNVQSRRMGISGTPEEAAEREFTESSMRGKRTAQQAAADILHAVLLGPKNVFGGLGLVRSVIGTSDADVLKYATLSTANAKRVAAAIRASKIPGVTQTLAMGPKSLQSVKNSNDAKARERAAQDEQERKTRAAARAGDINVTISNK